MRSAQPVAQRFGLEKAAMRQHGAASAGHHRLGCAKAFALIGSAVAAATLEMEAREYR